MAVAYCLHCGDRISLWEGDPGSPRRLSATAAGPTWRSPGCTPWSLIGPTTWSARSKTSMAKRSWRLLGP